MIPWRSIVVATPLLFPLIPLWVGLGSFAGALMVGAFVFVFALPLAAIIFIERERPPRLANRLAGLARTLASASVVIAVFAGWTGGGGLGHALSQAWMHMEYAQAAGIFWEIVAITLLVDILLGVVQSMLPSFDGQ